MIAKETERTRKSNLLRRKGEGRSRRCEGHCSDPFRFSPSYRWLIVPSSRNIGIRDKVAVPTLQLPVLRCSAPVCFGRLVSVRRNEGHCAKTTQQIVCKALGTHQMTLQASQYFCSRSNRTDCQCHSCLLERGGLGVFSTA